MARPRLATRLWRAPVGYGEPPSVMASPRRLWRAPVGYGETLSRHNNRYEAANLAAKALPGAHLEPGAIITPCLGSALQEARVLRAYVARKLRRKPKGKKGKKPLLELQRLGFAYPGNTVTLVVETIDMRGAEVEVRMYSAAGGALSHKFCSA